VQVEGDRAPLEALVAYLRDMELLLLIDNFEHVLEAAPPIAELLRGAPSLKVLVTSRIPLRLSEEYDVPVSPLSLPDLRQLPSLPELQETDAVALFLQRADAVSPGVTLTEANAGAIAEICVRLDGLPLAIELAAARMRLLSPQALRSRLTNRLLLLTDGARDQPVRLRTLRDAIAWSYDLLRVDEQCLFRRLSMFAGGFTLDAAEAVSRESEVGSREPDDRLLLARDSRLPSPDLVFDAVAALVDASLLRLVGGDGEPRYTMLETIREYGLDELVAAGEASAARRAHAGFYLTLAEDAAARLDGCGQVEALDRLEREGDNLRAALGSTIEAQDGAIALRFAAALWRFWLIRGYNGEGRDWLTRILAVSGSDAPAPRATACFAVGMLATAQGDYDEATAAYEAALPLWRSVNDAEGTAKTLSGLGHVAISRRDSVAARAWFEEALAISRGAGDERGIAAALTGLGHLASDGGDLDRAAELYDETIAVQRALGDAKGISDALNNRGTLARLQLEFARAVALYEESLALRRELGDRQGIAGCLNNLAVVAYHEGDRARSTALNEQSLAIERELGNKSGVAASLHNLAVIVGEDGETARGAALFGESYELYDELSDPVGLAMNVRELMLLAAGDHPEQTARLFGIAQRLDPADVTEEPIYAQAVAKVRARLGEQGFDRAVATGHGFSPDLAALEVATLVDLLSEEKVVAVSAAPTMAEGSHDLSPREREVLVLLAQGKTNPEIASELFISRKTTSKHVTSILAKLGVETRTAAATYAVRQKLV
jgi:predicted ATPase/DNA-binding CsgD family transcriptional regulator